MQALTKSLTSSPLPSLEYVGLYPGLHAPQKTATLLQSRVVLLESVASRAESMLNTPIPQLSGKLNLLASMLNDASVGYLQTTFLPEANLPTILALNFEYR